MAETKKDKTLLSAYLVVGADSLKRDAIVKRMHARLEEYGDIAFNSDTFDGETAEGVAIVTACNTIPFASDKRLVEVRNCEKLKKSDSEPLVAYLQNPSEDTVLLLVAEKLASNTRLYKAVRAIGKDAVIDCAPPDKRELPAKVRAMAVSHGFTMTEAGARRLIEFVGEDTVRLDAELRKIALSHVGGNAVSDEEIARDVVRTCEVKWWTFVDAFADRKLNQALGHLANMQSFSPHALLPKCTTRIREIICAQSLMRRGSVASLAKELKVPDWKVKLYRGWARNFTASELRSALMRARDAERRMKSGSDADEVFREWVVETLKTPRR